MRDDTRGGVQAGSPRLIDGLLRRTERHFDGVVVLLVPRRKERMFIRVRVRTEHEAGVVAGLVDEIDGDGKRRLALAPTAHGFDAD